VEGTYVEHACWARKINQSEGKRKKAIRRGRCCIEEGLTSGFISPARMRRRLRSERRVYQRNKREEKKPPLV